MSITELERLELMSRKELEARMYYAISDLEFVIKNEYIVFPSGKKHRTYSRKEIKFARRTLEYLKTRAFIKDARGHYEPEPWVEGK